jgi:hypothetical protein
MKFAGGPEMSNKKIGSLGRGFGAGLIATMVLSIFMIVMPAIGLLPELNLVTVLSHALGAQSSLAGWIAHYVVGVLLWGALFAWLDGKMFFPHWINGLLFASVVWLGVMLVIMPIAGEGVFGLRIGIVTPTITLFLHWIYGAVLGCVYGAWTPGALRAIIHRLRHHDVPHDDLHHA